MLQHDFYSDGNPQSIAWITKSGESTIKQQREHAEIYHDKVTTEQSKYIAMHVGIFWSIGTFTIKNEDTVNLMLDSKKIFEHLSKKLTSTDEFIEKRTCFFRKLIEQRKLHIKYQLIEPTKNIASQILKK